MLVDALDIAGIEPPVGRHYRLGGRRIVPVTEHEVGAANQQGIVRAEFHLYPRDGTPHARRKIVLDGVAAYDRTGLRHAVALQDGQAQTDKYP